MNSEYKIKLRFEGNINFKDASKISSTKISKLKEEVESHKSV